MRSRPAVARIEPGGVWVVPMGDAAECRDKLAGLGWAVSVSIRAGCAWLTFTDPGWR